MLGAALTLFGVVTFFMWAVLGHSTPAEQQQTLDSSCPAQTKIIRYPAAMGGDHAAVCNPTFITWRN